MSRELGHHLLSCSRCPNVDLTSIVCTRQGPWAGKEIQPFKECPPETGEASRAMAKARPWVERASRSMVKARPWTETEWPRLVAKACRWTARAVRFLSRVASRPGFEFLKRMKRILSFWEEKFNEKISLSKEYLMNNLENQQSYNSKFSEIISDMIAMNPDAAAITRVNLGVMRLKGIVRQILKLAIGCSKSFHYVQPPEVIA